MMQSPKLILMQLQRIDDILKFYNKCPDGKRGRPMGVGKAAALEKASPGSICAKEVKANPSRGKGERTIFYKNKTKGEANTPTEKKKDQPTQSEEKRVEQEPIESGNVADHESKKTTTAPRTDTKFPVNKKEQDLQVAFRPIAEENNESLNPKQKELLHGFADRMAMMRSKSKQQDDVATETEKFKRARDLFLEVVKERPDLLERMKKVQGVSASDVPLFLALEVYKAIYNPDSLEGDPNASAYKQDLLGISRGEAVPNIQKILPDQKLEIATAQSESQKKWAKIFHRQMSSNFRKYASSFLAEHPQEVDYFREAWANLHQMPTAGSIFGLRSVKGNQLLLSLLSPQSTESLAGKMGINLVGSENGKRFVSIMRGKFKDNPEFQKALTAGQPWPQHRRYSNLSDIYSTLEMLDHVDSILKFLAECPGNKRGRPMKPENAQRLSQASPDSICTKKTASGNTRYYRTGPKGKSSNSKKKKSLWERIWGKKKVSRRKKNKGKSSKSSQPSQEIESKATPNAGMDTEKISNDLAVLKDIMATLKKEKKPSLPKEKLSKWKDRFDKFKTTVGDWKRKHPVLSKVAWPVVKIALSTLGIPLPFQANHSQYVIYRLNRFASHIQKLEGQRYGHHTTIRRMEKDTKIFPTPSCSADRY